MTVILIVVFVPLIGGYLASLREDAAMHKRFMRVSSYDHHS